MRIYISGPLQGSSDLVRARRLYESISDALKLAGHDPYVPHLHTDPERAAETTAEMVFHTDVRELLTAEVVVAHIGEPSTGVGAELAIASQEQKQIIGVRRASETASRFAVGLILAAGGSVVTFEDNSDAGSKVVDLLAAAALEMPQLASRTPLCLAPSPRARAC